MNKVFLKGENRLEHNHIQFHWIIAKSTVNILIYIDSISVVECLPH